MKKILNFILISMFAVNLFAAEVGNLEQKHLMDELESSATESLTPLISAVIVQDIEAIKDCLIKKTCNINAQDKNGMTALHWAISFENDEIIEILMGEKNLNVRILDNSNTSPMGLAVYLNKLNLAKELCKMQGDPYFGVKRNLIPKEQNQEMIKFLSHEKNQYQKDNVFKNYVSLDTIIFKLELYKDNLSKKLEYEPEVIGTLTKSIWLFGKNQYWNRGLNTFNKDGITLIEAAFKGKYLYLFKYLLEQKATLTFSLANPTAQETYQEYLELLKNMPKPNDNPKINFVYESPEQMVNDNKLALEKAEIKNINDESYDSELEAALKESEKMYAAKINKDSVDNKVDSFKKEKGQEMIAAFDFGDFNEVSNLIKLGADLTITDDAGNNALHLAVINGNTDLVDLLLTKKINRDLKNHAELTPLDLAKNVDNRAIIKMLTAKKE